MTSIELINFVHTISHQVPYLAVGCKRFEQLSPHHFADVGYKIRPTQRLSSLVVGIGCTRVKRSEP